MATIREWQKLSALLEELEPRLKEAIVEAIQRKALSIDVNELERLILERNIGAIEEALKMSEAFYTPATENIRAAYVAGGQAVGDLLTVTLRAKFGFGVNPRAEAWARDMSSRMIEGVNENLPEIQGYIEQAAGKGIPARAVALDIVGRMDATSKRRTGGLLGLTSAQTNAAIRARSQLEQLDSGYFDRKLRDRRFDATVRRAIKAGKPLTTAEIDRIAGRYKDRLLKHRGDVIARTETLNALRAGQHEGFRQMVESGLIEGVTVKWQATADGRTRDSHVALNGTTISMGQMFTSPATGAQMEFPGDIAHGARGEDVIQCRCVAIYRVERRQ